MFFNGLTDYLDIDFGERLVNAVASQSIKYLFTKSEPVEVFVRCPWLSLYSHGYICLKQQVCAVAQVTKGYLLRFVIVQLQLEITNYIKLAADACSNQL